MKVTVSSVVLAALLGLVDAKVHLTNSNFSGIEAGSTFEITWDDAEGPVTLTLKNGPEDDLNTVQIITTGASGDSFTWPVDPSLVTGDYAIEISDGTDVNYSAMFPVSGTTAPSSSASTTVSITSTTASSTSTSSSETTESSSTESSSTESSSTELTSTESSTTSAESTSTESSSSAETTTATSTKETHTSSSTPTPTESDTPPETSVPNTNGALSAAAPMVPGLIAMIGAALL